MSISSHQAPEAATRDPAAPRIVEALGEIRRRGAGLFSLALVMVNGDLSFDEQNGYRTPVMAARSGGSTRYSLTGTGENDHRCPPGVGRAQARMSKQDSEVATLQEAYDWIEDRSASLAPTDRVRVVVVGNIGPCTGCKARLSLFLQDVVQLLGHGRVTVESVYDTDRMYVTKVYDDEYDDYETGDSGTVETTYGYHGATVETYVPPVGDSVSYWLYQVS